MQYLRVNVSMVLTGTLALALAVPARAQTPSPAATTQPAAVATRPAATQPAATQPAFSDLATDPASIRRMIAALGEVSPLNAANASAGLKLLTKRGVPVWEQLREGDSTAARGLLTWLRDHPDDIHHPSPLRLEWNMMSLFPESTTTGEIRLMANVDLIKYGHLALEMLRDGDPYGYWALMDVARTSTEVNTRGSDPVTIPLTMQVLDRHLNMNLTGDLTRQWQGYWAKPIDEPRPYDAPVQISPEATAASPTTPWGLPTRLVFEALDMYKAELERLGLWQTPPWVTQYTSSTDTKALLEGMATKPFPARQHIGRLLRTRLHDAEARKAVEHAILAGHPQARMLDFIVETTPLAPYVDSLRKAWPKTLEKQCPGMLADAVSGNPRRLTEASFVMQNTLYFWPDREWVNRIAIDLFEATGRGATEFSTIGLLAVDNARGVNYLMDVYRKGDMPDRGYNGIHMWMIAAIKPFVNECQAKDLAPLILKLSTATEPAIDTSRQDWSEVLRMSYELAWWSLNKDQVVWNDKTHRLEVPAEKLVVPTEEQILSEYGSRGRILRRMMDAKSNRKVDLK